MNEAQIEEIKDLHAGGNWSIGALAMIYKVSEYQITKIVAPDRVARKAGQKREYRRREKKARMYFRQNKAREVAKRVMELKNSENFRYINRDAQIRELRRCGMRQADLAEEYGLTQGQISKICRNLEFEP